MTEQPEQVVPQEQPTETEASERQELETLYDDLSDEKSDGEKPQLEEPLGNDVQPKEEEETKEEAEPSDEEPEPEDKSEETDETDEVKLPENMPKDLQTKLQDLSDEEKKLHIDVFKSMQSGFTKKHQELAENQKFLDGVNTAFEKTGLDKFYAQQGVSKATVIEGLVSVGSMLLRDPVNGVKQIAQAYNVDLNRLVDKPIAPEDDYRTDAEIAGDNRIKILEQEILALKQGGQISLQNQISQQVAEFRSAQNPDGNLKHPHFTEVEKDMAAFLAIDKDMTLEQAYNKAVRANDKLFEATVSQRLKKQKKAEEEKVRKVVNMKKQSISNTNINSERELTDRERLSMKYDELAKQGTA